MQEEGEMMRCKTKCKVGGVCRNRRREEVEGGMGDTRRRKKPQREIEKDSSEILTENILKTKGEKNK